MRNSPTKQIIIKKASFIDDAFKIFGDQDISYLQAMIIALDFIIKYKKNEVNKSDLNSYKYKGYFYISIFKEGD